MTKKKQQQKSIAPLSKRRNTKLLQASHGKPGQEDKSRQRETKQTDTQQGRQGKIDRPIDGAKQIERDR